MPNPTTNLGLTKPTIGDTIVWGDQLNANFDLIDAAVVARDAATLATAEAYTDSHAGAADWAAITGKPATFPPSAHTHPESDVVSLVSDLAAKESIANKDVANGYAGLDSGGKVVFSELPVATTSNIGAIKRLAAVANKFLTSIDATGTPIAAQPDFTDLTGTAAAAQLPDPTSSTKGGVKSKAAVSNNFLTQISTDGSVLQAQPGFADLSGSLDLATKVGSSILPAANGGVAQAGANEAFFPTRGASFSLVPGATGTSSPTVSANQVFVFKFVLPIRITINKITYSINISSASDKWGFGIYNSAGTSLLVDSGIVSPTTSGPIWLSVTLGAPVTLNPGTYSFAQTASGTTATTDFDYIADIQAAYTKNVARMGLATNVSSGGQLPATLGSISSATQRGIMLVLFEN